MEDKQLFNPPALNGNGHGNGVVAPAYVSAVGGAPTDDTQWYKDWRYWAVYSINCCKF